MPVAAAPGRFAEVLGCTWCRLRPRLRSGCLVEVTCAMTGRTRKRVWCFRWRLRPHSGCFADVLGRTRCRLRRRPRRIAEV